jgi:hypothetical protein
MSDPYEFSMEPFAATFVPISHEKNLGPKHMAARRTRSEVDQQIDENLKRVYDDALNEAVPDRFLDLIEQLRAAETPPQASSKDSDDA